MGRRALRKPDSNLVLEPFLRSMDDLEPPLDLSRVMGRVDPIEVEVGSGKGLFLATAAQDRPEHCFVGVEISRKYARFAAARLAKREIDNAILIHGDARRLITELLVEQSVQTIHVYFPDPWWKKRHQRRRVFTPSFVEHVERVLLPGGTLQFWTDVQSYFDDSCALVVGLTKLEGPCHVPERPVTHDLDYCTHFERRMRLNGQPIFRAEFRKRGTVAI